MKSMKFPSGFSKMPNTSTQDFAEYVRLSDQLFPNLFRLQRTVVLLRPSVIRLGLSDVIASYFTQKNYVVLHRSTTALSDYESFLLAKLEKVPLEQYEQYKEIMQETHVESILLTKYGAIPDAYQVSYEDEKILIKTETGMPDILSDRPESLDTKASFTYEKITENKSSKDAKFQKDLVDPAKSLNHLLNAEIEKHRVLAKKLYLDQKEVGGKKLDWEKKHIVCRDDEESINQLICLFSNKFSQISDAIVMLNPLYFDKKEELKTLLNRRLRFKIINQIDVNIDGGIMKEIIADYCRSQNFPNFEDISNAFKGKQTTLFHVTKPGGYEELKVIFELYANKTCDNILIRKGELTPLIQPHEIPHYFIPTLSASSHKYAQDILNSSLVYFSGEDLLRTDTLLHRTEQIDRLDYMLETTVGEKIKRLNETDVKDLDNSSASSWKDKSFIVSTTMPHIAEQGYRKKLICSDKEICQSVIMAVESVNIGYYEIRVKRVPVSLQNEPITSRRECEKIKREFKIRALYYNKVNEIYPDYTPSFYQFRIYQRGKDLNKKLDFAYECEEHMGRMFIHDIAITMKKYREAEKTVGFENLSPDERRGSLVAHLWGQKIARMCRKINLINAENVKGFGHITEIQGGSKSSKKYACEMDEKHPSGEGFWRVKAEYIQGLVKKIENFVNDIPEQIELVNIIRKWLSSIWEKEEYVEMWKDSELFLVPDRINEYNVRIYGKVTRLTNIIKDLSDNLTETLEIRRFNPQFEKVIANLPTDPSSINIKTGMSFEKSLMYMKVAAAVKKARATPPGTANQNEEEFSYDFSKKIEFEDRKLSASPVKNSLYNPFSSLTLDSNKPYRAAYVLVQKKNPSIVNTNELGKRTRHFFTAMMLWLVNVRLRRFKLYEAEFEDSKDYVVCLNNIIMGIATYFEKNKLSENEKSHIQCEYLFYGLKEASDTIDEIKEIKLKIDKLDENNNTFTNFSFRDAGTMQNEGKNSVFLVPAKTAIEENKKTYENMHMQRHELTKELKAKQRELDEILLEVSNPTLTKFLVFDEDVIHIERERYYQPAIHEYWEPNLKHEKFTRIIKPNNSRFMDLLPDRLRQDENISDVQRSWMNPEPRYKSMLRPYNEKTIETEVTLNKMPTEADKKMKDAIARVINKIKSNDL